VIASQHLGGGTLQNLTPYFVLRFQRSCHTVAVTDVR
jgi:hypothetical protein